MGWKRRTSTGLITPGRVNLTQVIVLSARTDDGVTVYDGLDAAAAFQIAELQGEAAISTPVYFKPPLYCENGIYVSLDTNVTEVTVIYEPVRP